MLTITEDAITAIRSLTRSPGVPGDAGIRISSDDTGRFTVSLAGRPEVGDDIVEDSGARLFVAADAAEYLENKALDADVDLSGSVTFGVRDQLR